MVNLDFIKAGNATFTVASPTKERYTYKVTLSKKIGLYFVSVLTGPNNRTDYTYIGRLSTVDHLLKITAKSAFPRETKLVKVFNWAMEHIKTQKPVPNGYFLEHNGSCGRCGRKLTTPESIKAGLGPVCRGK